MKEEIKKYLATNDNENTTTQKLQDAAKAVQLNNTHATLTIKDTRFINYLHFTNLNSNSR